MTLGQLRSFLAVARTGSVRRAAGELYVSEPSVSAAVAALARAVKAELFERRGRGLRLTPAGEALEQYAREALGLLDQGLDAARQAARPGTGRLRLAAVTTAGEYVAPPILKAFLERYPDLEPTIEVGNRAQTLERLVSREADIAIGGRPPLGRGIAGIEFLPNDLLLVASPDRRLARIRQIEASELADETWLLREPGSGTRSTTEEFLTEYGIKPRRLLNVGSNGAIKEAAAVGLGITLISGYAVAHDIATGHLAALRAPGVPVTRSWFALHPDRGRLPGPSLLFLDFLRSPSTSRLVSSPQAARPKSG